MARSARWLRGRPRRDTGGIGNSLIGLHSTGITLRYVSFHKDGRSMMPVSPAQTERQARFRPARPASGAADGSATLAPSATQDLATGVGTRTPIAPVLSGRALALVLVASFMVVLDFSIVNVALPSMREALG